MGGKGVQGLAGVKWEVCLDRAAFRTEHDPAFFKKHDKQVLLVNLRLRVYANGLVTCSSGTGAFVFAVAANHQLESHSSYFSHL